MNTPPMTDSSPNALIIEAGHGFGGSVVSASKTVHVLKEMGWRVRVLVLHNDPTVAEYFACRGIEVLRVYGYRRADRINAFLQRFTGNRNSRFIKRLILAILVVCELPMMAWPLAIFAFQLKRCKPDLVVFNNEYQHVLVEIASKFVGRRRCVIHVRDFPKHTRWNPVPKVWPMMVANSKAVRERLLTLGCPPSCVQVVYNPFDFVKEFSRVSPIQEEPWSFSRSCKIGLFGSLEPWKGHEVYIEAARIVCQRKADVDFFIVGGESLSTIGRERELRAFADQMGLGTRMRFLGYRSDVFRVMKAMNIIVHCSISPEPFGNVIVEAMLLGRAVIASDAGGTSEIVTNGEDGLLVKSGDPQLLAPAIQTLLDDPALTKRLSENSVNSARSKFSRERFSAQIQALYLSQLKSEREMIPGRDGSV